MFSSCVGMPYRFFTAVPYENALSVYAGNCAFVGRARGRAAATRPLAASWPVQSCAPMMTSGAVAGSDRAEVVADLAEVLDDDLDGRAAGLSPRFATWVTAALRSLSAQIVIVDGLRCRVDVRRERGEPRRRRAPTRSAACASFSLCLTLLCSEFPRARRARRATACETGSYQRPVTACGNATPLAYWGCQEMDPDCTTKSWRYRS